MTHADELIRAGLMVAGLLLSVQASACALDDDPGGVFGEEELASNGQLESQTPGNAIDGLSRPERTTLLTEGKDDVGIASPIDNVRKCTEFPGRGRLCTKKVQGGIGYNSEFYAYSGMSRADFNLRYHSGLIGSSEGPFRIDAGGYHFYFFAVGDLGCGQTVLWDRTGALPPLYANADCE